jgi:hypothetical protein
LFAPLKARSKLAGRPAKKGELVRAGLRLLISLDEAVLVEHLHQLDAKRRDRQRGRGTLGLQRASTR